MVLEGDRLIDDALAHGHEPEVVLIAERRSGRARELEAALAGTGTVVRLISDALLDSLSALQTSPGILALVPMPARRTAKDLDELLNERAVECSDALIVVACGVQDPGNLGALVRTAEAAGASEVVVAAGGCRPWNEKALRGSMGSLLRMRVFEVEDASDAWDAVERGGFRHVIARTRGGADPSSFDWSGCVALWVTAESGALPEALGERIAQAEGVTIPMAGGVESLNVTTAAAVLLFAAGRSSAPDPGGPESS